MTTIVAFAGRMSSGKSTASKFFMDNGYVDMKLAGPLKSMLASMYTEFGLTPAEIEARLEGSRKETPDSFTGGKAPRFLMQTLGTEWRNGIDANLWANALDKRLKMLDTDAKITVSDYRFEHEYHMLRRNGAIIISILRPDSDMVQDTYTKHPSENFEILPKGDFTVINDGTKDEFHRKLQKVMDTIERNIENV